MNNKIKLIKSGKKKKCRSTKSTELSIRIQTQITILKLIKLEQKKRRRKKKKSKADPSEPWWGGHAVVGGEKRDPFDPFACEKEREILECSGVDKVLEKKKEKRKVKRRNARKE